MQQLMQQHYSLGPTSCTVHDPLPQRHCTIKAVAMAAELATARSNMINESFPVHLPARPTQYTTCHTNQSHVRRQLQPVPC
mmetsp:Transcript_36829/g.92984  ORF Transcript_36829/g.92984 Transcript_36829/m.92984 type:complete len:81 (-) Transcript_36829:963-1205(-)